MKIFNSLVVSALLGMSVNCAHTDKNVNAASGSVPLHIRISSFDAGDAVVDPVMMSELERIADVKNYGINVFGLSDSSNNYLRYRESEDARMVYRLYMTPRTVLPESIADSIALTEDTEHREPHASPIMLRSSVDDLFDEEEFYENQGLDTMHRSIMNFSDIEGCDLTPEFLNSDWAYQVRTLFHEDWHSTFDSWHPKKNIIHTIHEPAAMVLGYAGAIEYFRQEHGESSKEYAAAVQTYEDIRAEADVITDSYAVLKKIYDSEMSDDAKIASSEVVFDYMKSKGYHHNNATLMDRIIYMKYFPLMTTVHERAGSVTEFVNVMRDCPIEEKPAVEYLVKYLAGS
ncbi:MAG: hypothetical protein V1729_05260 [Candidatus Woesearchaeota archaeon]